MTDFMKPLKDKAEKVMRKEATFASENEALEAAKKYTEDDLVSIWKAPKEMGGKYTIVKFENREEAGICGYEEVCSFLEVARKVNGRGIDEIEEV